MYEGKILMKPLGIEYSCETKYFFERKKKLFSTGKKMLDGFLKWYLFRLVSTRMKTMQRC